MIKTLQILSKQRFYFITLLAIVFVYFAHWQNQKQLFGSLLLF
jgi:hypothetical protein